MRLRLLPLVTALLLFAASAVVAECNPDSISIRRYGHYETRGYRWNVVIVPAKLSPECLIALATSLHKAEPESRVDFFDAESKELSRYLYCNDRDLANCDYSDAWVDKHTVGALQPTSDGIGCGVWAVLDKHDHVIAKLDRLNCETRRGPAH